MIMSYIQRNENGEITGLFRWPQTEGQERLAEDHPDVVAFRNRPMPPGLYEELLDALDEVAAKLPPEERTKLDALLTKRAAST